MVIENGCHGRAAESGSRSEEIIMQVTITELNARRNGEVINGYNVDLQDITLSGSDKQVAWATEILTKETRVLVETFIATKAKHAGHAATILTEAEADQWIGEINATLGAQAAPKLQGANAGKIIEARNGGLPAILKALA
jgi:hypothetical protein